MYDIRSKGASIEATVVGAAFTVLNKLYPEQQAAFNGERVREEVIAA